MFSLSFKSLPLFCYCKHLYQGNEKKSHFFIFYTIYTLKFILYISVLKNKSNIVLSGFFFGNFAFQQTKGTNLPVSSAIKTWPAWNISNMKLRKPVMMGVIHKVHMIRPPPPSSLSTCTFTFSLQPLPHIVWADE